MARIKIEEILEHFGYEVQKSLSVAVKNVLPDVEFEEKELYKSFINAISKQFISKWENVPDRLVDAD